MKGLPIPGFNFKVAFHPPLDDNALGFMEVSGIELGLVPEGSAETKLITLKRGLLPFNEFSQWYTDVLENNKTNFRDLDIVLLNREGKPKAAWKAHKTLPEKWFLDPLSSMESNFAFETLQLSYEKIKRIK